MTQHIIEILTQNVDANHDLAPGSHQLSYLGIAESREAGFRSWCDKHEYAPIKSEVNGTGDHYRDEYICEPIPSEFFDQIVGKRGLIKVLVGDVKNKF